MKKKIDFVFGNLYSMGGQQGINVLLANALAGDYDVTLVSFFKTGEAPCFDIDPRVHVRHLFGAPFSLKRHLWKTLLGMRRYVRSSDADIIVFSSPAYAIFAEPFVKPGVKTVYWHHQAFDFGRTFGLEWWGVRTAARFGDAVVCLTQRSLKDYRSRLRKVRRVEQIYNTAPCGQSSLPYDDGARRIISCGRLNFQKGFDLLPGVAAKVLDRHPDWRWDIYGEGPERARIEALIAQFGLQGRLVLNGACSHDDLYRAYPQYGIFVLTSRFEGFSLAVIEAQCAKLPIVSFNCPTGPDEVVEEGGSGFLVDCFDQEAMARRICALIEDPALRRSFSARAALSSGRFTAAVFTEKWSRLLASLAEGGAA